MVKDPPYERGNMEVDIVAIGCARCRFIEVATHAALEDMGLNVEIENIP